MNRNDRQLRLFAVDCARQCECFHTKAAAELIAIAFRFACGEASSVEISKVRERYDNLAFTGPAYIFVTDFLKVNTL